MNGYSKFEVVADTDIVNGIQCKRISQISYQQFGIGTIFIMRGADFFTYENSGHVFVSKGNQFHLIQNWNALPGDTVSFLWENLDFASGCSDSIGHMIIDSVGTININGLNYKQQFVHYYDSIVSSQSPNKDFITEHFGANNYFFFYRSICDSISIIDVFYYLGLACYYEPLVGWIYFNQGSPGFDCDYLNATEKINNEEFYLSPNPATNKVYILYPNLNERAEVKITDLMGRVHSKQSIFENEFNLNLEKMSSGYYFINILSSKGILTKKLLIL